VREGGEGKRKKTGEFVYITNSRTRTTKINVDDLSKTPGTSGEDPVTTEERKVLRK